MEALTIINILVLISTLSIGSAAYSDVVTDWDAAALNAIRANRIPPPIASHALAILHASIYDAVNGISRANEAYLVQSAVPASASKEAAVSAAAHKVLVALFPMNAPSFDDLNATTLTSISKGPHKSRGIDWGESVAGHILALRLSDGSAAMTAPPSGSGPGFWQPTPPQFAPYLLPQWGVVAPFTMPSSHAFRPPGPPVLGSATARRVRSCKAMKQSS